MHSSTHLFIALMVAAAQTSSLVAAETASSPGQALGNAEADKSIEQSPLLFQGVKHFGHQEGLWHRQYAHNYSHERSVLRQKSHEQHELEERHLEHHERHDGHEIREHQEYQRPPGEHKVPQPHEPHGQHDEATHGSNEHPDTGRWEDLVLRVHNERRTQFKAVDVEWSQQLYREALEWAQKCTLTHDRETGDGENLSSSTRASYSLENAMNAWMSEYSKYQYDQPPPYGSPGTGHFTQVVWKNTKYVGCAEVKCETGAWSRKPKAITNFVCRYHPAGNTQGEYVDNVGMPEN
ncbi:hypothetical protein V5O48_004326 [Marasmius crinis-equi]|uniref:SCP domain-containing protein n=1 Tax=Marasmius crinis-equi TaxID=585013 RepID=A0ABR3FQE9_9AGAR